MQMLSLTPSLFLTEQNEPMQIIWPANSLFRCCKMHDYCYHAANCPKFLEYFVPYLWKCYHGRPLCGRLIKSICKIGSYLLWIWILLHFTFDSDFERRMGRPRKLFSHTMRMWSCSVELSSTFLLPPKTWSLPIITTSTLTKYFNGYLNIFI